MPQTLPEFLKGRAEDILATLLTEAQSVEPQDAMRGRHATWPDHRWGIGQDGSIAGIVFHVTAWKQMTLPLFQPEGKALSRSEFASSTAPDPNDWPGIVAWLQDVGTRWNAALADVPDSEFDSLRTWEGTSITLTQYVVEMIEHDIQHTAQIAYLRQLYRSEAAP